MKNDILAGNLGNNYQGIRLIFMPRPHINSSQGVRVIAVLNFTSLAKREWAHFHLQHLQNHLRLSTEQVIVPERNNDFFTVVI